MESVLTPEISTGTELNCGTASQCWRIGELVWKKIHTFDVRSCVIKDTKAGHKGHEARKQRAGPRGEGTC